MGLREVIYYVKKELRIKRKELILPGEYQIGCMGAYGTLGMYGSSFEE